MTAAEKLEIDTTTIRQTYDAGFCCASTAEADRLHDLLTAHVQLLIPEVYALTPRMREDQRRLTDLVICRAKEHLEKRLEEWRAAPVTHVYDLATSSRALLTLYEYPGPLDEGQKTPVDAGK
ncbi:DUF6415 family natural product biosynthesis protein [Streptomyces sp. NPDC001795]|uniref:DUF6415 family natural product biosynthesis protein n=1 Tax=Streptomyces sp. NPDC001795 TaxID=3154525 RepID=UPI003322EBED